MKDFGSLVEEIESFIAPEYGWLVRSDIQQGYLANIYEVDSLNPRTFPVFALSKEDALGASFNAWRVQFN